MTDSASREQSSPLDLMSAWLKTTSDFWSTMAQAWAAPGGSQTAETAMSGGRFQESLASGMRLWEAAARSLSQPAGMEVALKGLQTAPDISMRLFQTTIQGVFELQKRWTDHLEKLNDSDEPYSYKDLDREFLNRWTDVYQKEFQQFLKVPQLGLTKFYQEKMNRMVDTYNLFQAAMAEFMQLLMTPADKSVRVMQEKIAEFAERGDMPEDTKTYYNMWIKVLEGHYMTLFKSEEYVETMSKTLNALNEFLSARDAAFEDALKLFPIPTNRDMDELYREIYDLKRRLRSFEKGR